MLFLRFISHLPLHVLYGLSDFLFVLAYYVVGYRRQLVRMNLTNSFPEKSEAEIIRIEKEFYRNLCDYAAETLKLITIPAEELRKRMRYTNPELVFQYRDQNQSVLLLSSHQFNWEWLLASGMISLGVPIDFVYQPVNNGFVDKLLQACRTRFGGHPIKRNKVARELARRKNMVRGIALVADQYPGLKSDKRFEMKFLHQDTVFFYGSQQIATLTQYPAIYAVVEKASRGYYTCTLIPVGHPPYGKNSQSVIENYGRAVEKVIQNHPGGWLWSHNRWKTRHLKKTESAEYRAG